MAFWHLLPDLTNRGWTGPTKIRLNVQLALAEDSIVLRVQGMET